MSSNLSEKAEMNEEGPLTDEFINTLYTSKKVNNKKKMLEELISYINANPNYIIQSSLKNANSCEKCGNSSWMGHQIPLKISLKDDTMEALCPNCFAIFGVDNEK